MIDERQATYRQLVAGLLQRPLWFLEDATDRRG